MKKPSECPKCKSSKVLKIEYGEPDMGYFTEEMLENEVYLGGCCITEESKKWHCGSCDWEWELYEDEDEEAKDESSKKIIGYLLLIIIVTGIVFFQVGKNNGRNEANSIFLEHAFIESCKEDGTSCLLETNQGQKTIYCNEHDNCITQEKIPGEREKEMKVLLDLINKLPD